MPRLRSLLFVPGDRPDRMEKALGLGADALILDLEDSVTLAAKPAAREAVAAFLAGDRPVPLYVRINPLDSGLADDDLAAVLPARPDGIAITLVFAYSSGVKLETFLSIITALYLCYEPIKKIGYLNSELNRGMASLTRLEYVLHEPLTITDPAQPRAIDRLQGQIAFKGVTFAYDETPALSDIDVAIPPGTVCALVGPSGAGKSTFVNLVPRFYETAAGSVTIDGIDVRAMRLADLRRNIALVSQEPVLFNDTIYNNLALGQPAASRDAILDAARQAHAHEFIEQLPQGYDTLVGERGALLSGGQKQRIAIARAFLRQAPILILDEATSALDSESEAAVQDALRKLVVGKTVLIIAHRFSTIRDATMILVFDQGRIVAQGNHASLYAGNSLYKSLYDRQSVTG